jgi:hypothetical protein
MTRTVSLPMASRSAGTRVVNRAPPMARPSGGTPSDVCALQSPGVTGSENGSQMSKVCVPGGQVPSGHLFESLNCGYIVSEIGPPDLTPPHNVLNPSRTLTLPVPETASTRLAWRPSLFAACRAGS